MQQTNEGKTKSNRNNFTQPTTVLIAIESHSYLERKVNRNLWKPSIINYHTVQSYYNLQQYLNFITYVREYILTFYIDESNVKLHI